MVSFVTNPISYGVRAAADDAAGGPLIQELVAGTGIALAEIDAGGGDKKVRITATGGAAGAYVGTVNPTPQNDDVDTAGLGRTFDVGDHWINSNTDVIFVCVDNTTNNAIWRRLDTISYLQSDFNDDTTQQIVIGDITAVDAIFIQYFLTAPTLTRTRAGIMYVTHNGTAADLRDEYTEINGSINVTSAANINGSDLRIALTATSVGSNLKFRYLITLVDKVV